MSESVMPNKMPEEPARVESPPLVFSAEAIILRWVIVDAEGRALVLRMLDGRPCAEPIAGMPVGPSFEREGEIHTIDIKGFAGPMATGTVGAPGLCLRIDRCL